MPVLDLDLQKLSKNRPKKCDTIELPKLSGWSVHEQDRDSIIFQVILAPSPSFFLKCVFFLRGNINVRSVLDLKVRVLDQNGQDNTS